MGNGRGVFLAFHVRIVGHYATVMTFHIVTAGAQTVLFLHVDVHFVTTKETDGDRWRAKRRCEEAIMVVVDGQRARLETA